MRERDLTGADRDGRRRGARRRRSVECGARKGRAATSARPSSRPATLWIAVTSIASASASGGRMDGSRRASMVFPEPGGSEQQELCAPAAATSSARLACGWPRTSARSPADDGASARSAAASTVVGARGRSPRRWATASASVSTPITGRPARERGLGGVDGRDQHAVEARARARRPRWAARRARRARGRRARARRARTTPLRSGSGGLRAAAARMPRAIGRS